MKKITLIKFLLLITLLLAAQAYAYVLPAPVVLKLMTEHLGYADRLAVTQRLVLYGSEEMGKDRIELTENLSYRFPRSFRSHIQFETTERILVVDSGNSLSVLNGQIQPISQTRFDRYKDLLLYRSSDILQENLDSFGVDTSVSSLGRFEDQVVFVIGARYPDRSVSQIWISKDTFRPCRWIIKNGKDSLALDMVFKNWVQRQGLWYPLKIKFYQQNNLVREIYADEIKVGASFAPDLFDISRLESEYGSKRLEDNTPEKLDEPDEVQKTIEDFKRLYE